MMKKTTKRIIGLLFGVAFLLSITFPALAAYSHFETGVVSETGFYVGARGTEVEVISSTGTISTSEADIKTLSIDGTEIEATADEINTLADVTPGTVSAGKTVIADLYGAVDALDIGTLSINGSEVTSTAADINTLTGVASQFIVYQVEDLAADSDIAARALFVCPTGYTFTLSSAKIIAQGNSDGIDAGNTCAITVSNGTNAIVTKTYNNVTTFPDGAVGDLGTLNGTYKVLAAGEILKFSITDGSTANPPAMILQIVGELATVE